MKFLHVMLIGMMLAPCAFAQETTEKDLFTLLFSACGEEQQESFAEKIRRRGSGMEVKLIRMITDGPSQQRLQQIADHAARIFDRREARLAKGETLSMPSALLALMENDSKQAYIQRRVRSYRDGMIKQAMTALAVLGSAKGLRFLNKIKQDKTSPYRDHAIFVLRSAKR